MRQFYLRYQLDSEKTETPHAVRIGVSLNPIDDHHYFPDNHLDFQDRVYLKQTIPLEFLQELKEIISVNTSIKDPIECGIHYGLPNDKHNELHLLFGPKYPHHFGGEGENRARELADEYNKSLHPQLFKVYQDFVRQNSPECASDLEPRS